MKKHFTLCLVSLFLIFVAGCSSVVSIGAGTTNQPIAQEQTGSALPTLSYYFPRAGQHPNNWLCKAEVYNRTRSIKKRIFSIHRQGAEEPY